MINRLDDYACVGLYMSLLTGSISWQVIMNLQHLRT